MTSYISCFINSQPWSGPCSSWYHGGSLGRVAPAWKQTCRCIACSAEPIDWVKGFWIFRYPIFFQGFKIKTVRLESSHWDRFKFWFPLKRFLPAPSIYRVVVWIQPCLSAGVKPPISSSRILGDDDQTQVLLNDIAPNFRIQNATL